MKNRKKGSDEVGNTSAQRKSDKPVLYTLNLFGMNINYHSGKIPGRWIRMWGWLLLRARWFTPEQKHSLLVRWLKKFDRRGGEKIKA